MIRVKFTSHFHVSLARCVTIRTVSMELNNFISEIVFVGMSFLVLFFFLVVLYKPTEIYIKDRYT